MKMNVWAVGAMAAACLSLEAQDPAREQLRIALKDTEVKGNWFYDDLASGTSTAKKSGKPMMVVFR